MIRRSRRRK